MFNWIQILFEQRVAPANVVVTNPESSTLRGNNPIDSVADELISRAPSALSFSSNILKLDAQNGLVVGILGPWGSGKTSFVNLTRHYLE